MERRSGRREGAAVVGRFSLFTILSSRWRFLLLSGVDDDIITSITKRGAKGLLLALFKHCWFLLKDDVL